MNVFFHRGVTYLVGACVCLCAWPAPLRITHLHLGFTNAAPTYPWLLGGLQSSLALSPEVHKEFSSSKRLFQAPHAHTRKAVLALKLILAFLSERRKKPFMVWMLQRGFFSCV